MEIKGEDNALKLEIAKDLKQIAEQVVIGKNTETNTTNIKIEDNRKQVILNFNFPIDADPEQVEKIAERFKKVFLGQSEIVKISGDSTFAPHVEHKIPVSPILTGTAEALVIENRDYLIEGKGKPKFITNFKNLPSSVFVVHPEDISSNT